MSEVPLYRARNVRLLPTETTTVLRAPTAPTVATNRATKLFRARDHTIDGPRNEVSHRELKPEGGQSGNRLVIVKQMLSQCQTDQSS